jgi:hypothetical protein
MDSKEVKAHLLVGTSVVVAEDKTMGLMADAVDNSRTAMDIHWELDREVQDAEVLEGSATKEVSQGQHLHMVPEERVVECKVPLDTDEG